MEKVILVEMVRRSKRVEFEELDKRFERFFKDEFVGTPIDLEYQREFNELLEKYNKIEKELKGVLNGI